MSFFDKNVGNMNIWEFVLSLFVINLIVSIIIILIQKLIKA